MACHVQHGDDGEEMKPVKLLKYGELESARKFKYLGSAVDQRGEMDGGINQ